MERRLRKLIMQKFIPLTLITALALTELAVPLAALGLGASEEELTEPPTTTSGSGDVPINDPGGLTERTDESAKSLLGAYLPGASCSSSSGKASGSGIFSSFMKSAVGTVIESAGGLKTLAGKTYDEIKGLFKDEISHGISSDPEVKQALINYSRGEKDLNFGSNTITETSYSSTAVGTADQALLDSAADRAAAEAAKETSLLADAELGSTGDLFSEGSGIAGSQIDFNEGTGLFTEGTDIAGGSIDFNEGLNTISGSATDGLLGASSLEMSGAEASLATEAEAGAAEGAAIVVPVLDLASVKVISSGFATANANLSGIKSLNSKQLSEQKVIRADQDKLVKKEYCLDGIATGLMAIVIRTVKNMIIKWILTGNFEKPLFSVNLEADLRQSAENALRIYASKLTGIDFCNFFPSVPTIPQFAFNFKFGLECSFQKPFSAYINGLEFPGTETINDRILALMPENDPLQVRLLIAERAAQEAAIAEATTKEELAQGGGYFAERNKSGEITAPAALINLIAGQPTVSETRQRDLVDELGEAVAEIVNTAIGKVINGGINKIFKK